MAGIVLGGVEFEDHGAGGFGQWRHDGEDGLLLDYQEEPSGRGSCVACRGTEVVARHDTESRDEADEFFTGLLAG